MVSLVADTPAINHCLGRLITLSQAAGAEFSDDLVVKCINGNLSIEAPPTSAGKLLMRLPWDCLAPLELFRFAIADDKFVISSYEPGLTDTCIATMEGMLELYNLTNKFATHRLTSPWSLAASHPELLPPLLCRSKIYFFNLYQTLINSGGKDEVYLQSFFQTRTFNYSGATQAPPFLVLMPILDAMNHHYHGAPFSLDELDDRGPLLTMARSNPVTGTGDECFACYGPYDCFDIWLSYGFVDETWRFMRSRPITIDLPGLRRIWVTEIVKPRDQNALPTSMKDIGFFVPQIIARRKDQVTIASLAIPGPQTPRALRRALHFLINEVSPGPPHLPDLILEAERQIVTANSLYYQKLLDCLRATRVQDPRQQPSLDNFIHVCELQLGHLRDYTDYAKD